MWTDRLTRYLCHHHHHHPHFAHLNESHLIEVFSLSDKRMNQCVPFVATLPLPSYWPSPRRMRCLSMRHNHIKRCSLLPCLAIFQCFLLLMDSSRHDPPIAIRSFHSQFYIPSGTKFLRTIWSASFTRCVHLSKSHSLSISILYFNLPNHVLSSSYVMVQKAKVV